MRTSGRRTAWAVIVTLLTWFASGGRCYSGEVITNETIQKAVGSAHGVMKEQWYRIRNIMDAFIRGDLKAIQEDAETIADATSRVMIEVPTREGQEVAQLKRMADIIEQARLLVKASQEHNYQQAYISFSTMVGECIECHQGRRIWGVFPVPENPPAQSQPAPTQQTPAESPCQTGGEAPK